MTEIRSDNLPQLEVYQNNKCVAPDQAVEVLNNCICDYNPETPMVYRQIAERKPHILSGPEQRKGEKKKKKADRDSRKNKPPQINGNW